MRSRFTTLVVSVVLILAACGGDASPGTTTTTETTPPSTTTSTTASTTTTSTIPPGFPVDVTSEAGTVTIQDRPERIVALSATHVEMLFAVGAGEQVAAVDLFSNFPPEAVELPQVDSFNVNVEAVVALDPDLVVLAFDPGSVVDGLAAVGVPSLLFPGADGLSDVYDQIRAMGAATGRIDAANALVADMQRRIEDVITIAEGLGVGVSYYHETDPFSFYTPNGDTFIGSLYGLLGMQNIADAANDEIGDGYPQLSEEYILSADPDIIYLGSTGYGETAETVASRPGWDTMTAVQEGRIVELDTDVASRWGPRVVDLLEAIALGLREHLG